MSELRPPILDERDLGAALNDCAQQVFEGTNVHWEVKANGSPISLAPEVETVAYRVVREALVNVRKHAPDANVTVGLKPAGELLHVSIVDDGPGFDQDQPLGYSNGRRYGLIGMRERVDSVGGTWSLASASSGTRIELGLPGAAKVAA
jgi:signal transduction histidine kinase